CLLAIQHEQFYILFLASTIHPLRYSLLDLRIRQNSSCQTHDLPNFMFHFSARLKRYTPTYLGILIINTERLVADTNYVRVTMKRHNRRSETNSTKNLR